MLIREKAKQLWFEYKRTSGLLMYSPRQKIGYRTRVKNLAKQVSKSSLERNNIFALMYLGHIETWLDLDLNLYLAE